MHHLLTDWGMMSWVDPLLSPASPLTSAALITDTMCQNLSPGSERRTEIRVLQF